MFSGCNFPDDGKRKLIYQNRKISLLLLDTLDFQIWKVASGLIGSQSSSGKPLGTTFLPSGIEGERA
jgi:hypothetical protein